MIVVPKDLLAIGLDRRVKPVVTGIYMVYCIASEMGYFGSAVNLHRRIKKHRAELKAGSHGNIHLQRAYHKYGVGEFKFLIVRMIRFGPRATEVFINNALTYIENQYTWVRS